MLQKSWVKLFLIGLALASVTAFAFWPVHNHEFVIYDDDGNVFRNDIVQRGVNFKGVAWAFTIGEPLTMVSHMLVCHLFGLNAGAHHLVNLLFHVANTLLLFLLFHKMTGALWRSAFVAALFALHPLHVESVAWVSGRTDLLSTFFGLLTIWFYARYTDESKAQSPKTKVFYGLSLALFACGLLSKSMLVTLPCVLLLLDFWPLNRISFSTVKQRAARLLLEKVPYFLLVVGMSMIAFLTKKGGGAIAPLADLSILERIKNALVAYQMYLVKMFWPTDLAILYPIQSWPISRAFLAAVVLLVISIVVLRFASRRPFILVGWLWFLGILVPSIGLIQAGMQSMADRYTYFPLIGIFIIIAWGAYDLFRAPRFRVPLWTIATVILVLCTALTRAQVAHWRTSETLFEHALRSTKENYLLMGNLSIIRIEQNRLDEAATLLTEALKINPGVPRHWNSLTRILVRQGKTDAARRAYETALKINPGNNEARIGLGLLTGDGDPATEIRLLTEALKLHPDFAEGHRLLAEAHYKAGDVSISTGNIEEARQHYEKAVQENPDHVGAQCNLSFVLFKLDNPAAALPHAQTAARLDPESFDIRYTLSEILLRLGKFSEAEAQFRSALKLQPDQPLALNGVALALAGQKKWPEAETAFSRALALAQQTGDPKLVEEITGRFAQYRNEKR